MYKHIIIFFLYYCPSSFLYNNLFLIKSVYLPSRKVNYGNIWQSQSSTRWSLFPITFMHKTIFAYNILSVPNSSYHFHSWHCSGLCSHFLMFSISVGGHSNHQVSASRLSIPFSPILLFIILILVLSHMPVAAGSTLEVNYRSQLPSNIVFVRKASHSGESDTVQRFHTVWNYCKFPTDST